MNIRKSFAHVLVILLALILIAGGVYFYIKNATKDKSIVKLENLDQLEAEINYIPTEVDKKPVSVNPGRVFKDKQFDFEITLPDQWKNIETRKDQLKGMTGISFVINKKDSESSTAIYTIFTILISPKDDWLKNEKIFDSANKITEKDKNVYAYYINNSSDIRFKDQEELIKNLRSQIVDTIIPSFKFTKESYSTTGWKLYKYNDPQGIEFKYPESWSVLGSRVLDSDNYIISSNDRFLSINIYSSNNSSVEKCILGDSPSDVDKLNYKQFAKDVLIDGVLAKEIDGNDISPQYSDLITLGIYKDSLCYLIRLNGKETEEPIRDIIPTIRLGN
jgi:hypothetical protein